MNYLTHYYFFEKKDRPYYNCGLIFPDWLSAYGRIKFNFEIVTQNGYELDLKEGVLSHYLGDKIFHSSVYFKTYAHGIKELLETTSLNKDKLRFTFLAHVLLEMTIDRILLKINSDLGLSFYQSLAQCDTSYLLRFAKNNSAADDNFLALIQQFQKHQFVLKYNRTDVFIKSLVRIAQRVGIDINDSQALELMGKVDEIESYVKGGFTQLHLLFIKN